jgi:hypothetical protein
MTQPTKILWLTFSAAALLLLASRASAQTFAPTPPGQLIVVNNGPGNQTDPHVDGDLVCYTDQQNGAATTLRYHNLTTLTDNGVPGVFGVADFLCDVRGTTIVFIRDFTNAGVFTFDTASSTLTEIDPTPGSMRFGPQIGDQTIVWQDFGTSSTSSYIVAYDRTTGATTVLSPSSTSVINQNPGISSDGSIVAWESCPGALPSSCLIWKAVRSTAGTWTSQQLVSQVQGVQSHPETDGAVIAYSANFANPSGVVANRIVWQPAVGGTDQVLNIQGSAINPSVSGGLIAFDYDETLSGNHDIAVYDTASNLLYKLTNTPGDKTLNDISVTPDGKVRVVWQILEADWNVYAYTFNRPVGDFNLGAISPMTIAAGASGSTNVAVNPVNGFSSAVNLSVSGQPTGVTASLSPNSVTPSGGNAASSVLSVSLPSFIVPSNFALTVTGASGTLSHSTTASVSVTSTTNSITNLIGDLQAAGCVDNIANALTSKLAAAQAAIGAGNIQTAINTLTALKNQINAQAGKHIATSCTIAGAALNPVTVLLLDVQGLIDSLRVSMTPDPITGYLVDASGAGLAGASVSILDTGGHAVSTAATDITGFYFMATTGVLSPGAVYTLQVTGLPAGFTNSTPANQTFTWQGSAIALSNFVLN